MDREERQWKQAQRGTQRVRRNEKQEIEAALRKDGAINLGGKHETDEKRGDGTR